MNEAKFRFVSEWVLIETQDVQLPDALRASSEDLEDEHRLIDTLHQWLSRGEDRIKSLVDELPELDPSYQRRAIRALGGLIERSDVSYFDMTISSDPHVIYHLISECLHGDHPEARQLLEKFSDHQTDWIASRALATLAAHPDQNEPFLRERLVEESRQTVLIGFLKALYRTADGRFEEELIGLVERNDHPQVRFYAGVILKKIQSSHLENSGANSAFLTKLRDHVDVETRSDDRSG